MTKREQDKIRELVRDGRVAAVMQRIRLECWDCKYGILAGGACTGRGYMGAAVRTGRETDLIAGHRCWRKKGSLVPCVSAAEGSGEKG